ncbi:MAG: dienelactone hydrolase family protein [Gemmatimonadetes bacterium]|nr:dienelactone hydrolase family protein [Gemmatimonadota bacterium]
MSADWDSRDVSTQDVEVVRSDTVSVGAGTEVTVRVVAHTVGGVRHYGAVVVPSRASPASLPLLVVGHGGDDGVDIDDALLLLGFGLGSAVDDFVFVVPSFRSEPLTFQGAEYRSGGEPSPWDWDVDDALALLKVAGEITPEADPSRIGVVGFSRGACVGLLMAARDPRIDAVVEFFGPTDFFGTFVQDVVEEALLGMLRNLPGLADLDARFIQPLKRGELTVQDVRPELIRRSPVYFVDRLPQVQVHHGTADSTVPVSQAVRLVEVMEQAGGRAPGFEYYLYEGGGHNPLSLFGSLDRTVAFLHRTLGVLAAAR